VYSVIVETDWTLRALTYDDLGSCLKLAADRDWPLEERKWALLLDNGIGFGIEDQAGELVGSTIVTRYGAEHAAISMVLVAARHEGKGLGRRLIAHALEVADCPVSSLHATPFGRPLYEKFGFHSVGTVTAHFGRLQGAALSGTTRSALPEDLHAIARTDAEVFGADRTALWKAYFRFADQVRLDRSGGFAAVWRNVDSLVVGPVVAGSVDEAKVLINDLAVGADTQIRVDAQDAALGAWLNDRGVVPRSPVHLMVRGADNLPGDRARLYAPMMQALG
jgi:GNAT superfamily N-acetyltransferase